EDRDPDLAAALHVPGHGDAGGLDLAGRDPPRFEGLDAVVTEGDSGLTLGLALEAPALLLAVLDLLRHQHPYSSPARKCGVSWCWRVRRSISSSSANRRSSSGSASRMTGTTSSVSVVSASSAAGASPGSSVPGSPGSSVPAS